MSKIFIEETTLTAIANAIREKEGTTEPVPVNDMATRISAIETGGGELPEEALVITGSYCNYRFAYGGWDWFLELYGDRLTSKDLFNCPHMFNSTTVSEVPFILNLTSASSATHNFANAFYGTANLVVCPKLRGFINWSNYSTSFENILTYATKLRDAEDLLTPEMTEGFSTFKCTSAYSIPRITAMFKSCHSLRKIPSWWYNLKLNPESTAFPSYSYGLYYNAFDSCHALDEIKDIPVWTCVGAQTSNMFSSTFNNNSRSKALTFETNNGQSIAANWKTQTIDASTNLGYNSNKTYITNFNSGITADKEVKDDATYQALKNDPDWFTTKIEYSRYNHDSAVETINSLPDTSAYLASAGGTNTIKFKGAAGSATEGGAINTLTAEEIAVAAAKGWTVTLV